ncbi:DUF6894 family protein [Sphingomonas sp. MMS24-JH45]
MFHFNVHDGFHLPDRDGHDLPNLDGGETVRRNAGGELIRDDADDFWRHGNWRMDVTDADGLLLFALHFTAVEAPVVGRPGSPPARISGVGAPEEDERRRAGDQQRPDTHRARRQPPAHDRPAPAAGDRARQHWQAQAPVTSPAATNTIAAAALAIASISVRGANICRGEIAARRP